LTLRFARADLVDLADLAAESCRAEARERGVRIDRPSEKEDPRRGRLAIEADAAVLLDVLRSLAREAIGRTRRGGAVSIRLGRPRAGGVLVRVSFEGGRGAVRGAFPDPKVLGRCRAAVEAHGGTLRAGESHAGEAGFSVILPLKAGDDRWEEAAVLATR
jgi:signal transduction histidine kinase